MNRLSRWIVLVFVTIGVTPIAAQAEQAQSPSAAGTEESIHLVVVGRVLRVHAPGLFAIAHRLTDNRELLVLAEGAETIPAAGTVVHARGVVRDFTEAELADTRIWKELGESVRRTLMGRPVLVASSLRTAEGTPLMRDTGGALPTRAAPPRSAERGPAPAEPAAQVRPESTATAVRASTLADLIGQLAGTRVRIENARVVGVFEPRVFLIETNTIWPAMMGHRDRVLVAVESGALRVEDESLVSSPVTVVGVARTILGLQVTREVPWPSTLTRETVDRLEIRAAILATSVATAEGVELTDRPSTRSQPKAKPSSVFASGRQ